MHQGHLYGISGAPLKKKIEELLGEFNLYDRKKDLVEKLSGGLKRRVEVAKGLIHEPELLLLDEPSTGIDPGARLDLWNYLKRLREHRQVTIVVTTHLMEEAERCDRLGILYQGNLVACARPAELKASVGGTVINLQSQDNQALYGKLKKQFGDQIAIVDDEIHIERKDAEEFVLPLMREHSAVILSLTVKKPSLEDVFVRLTGHRFWVEAAEKAS
jgi:ABC-2 type transport system ATP-binding protein